MEHHRDSRQVVPMVQVTPCDSLSAESPALPAPERLVRLQNLQRELQERRRERQQLLIPDNFSQRHADIEARMNSLDQQVSRIESLLSAVEADSFETVSDVMPISRTTVNLLPGYSIGSLSSECNVSQEVFDAEAREDISVPANIKNPSSRCCGYLVGGVLGSGAFSVVRMGHFGVHFKSPEAVRLILSKWLTLEFQDDVQFLKQASALFNEEYGLVELIYDFMVSRDNSEKVAIKLTKKAPDGTKRREFNDQQFKTEWKIFRSVFHPNVLKCHSINPNFMYQREAGEPKQTCYSMVLELCENGSLFDFVFYNEEPVEEKLARTLFQQVCKGVAAVHKAGFVHRDIKPQNVVIDSNYVLKICDFGSSSKIAGSCLEDNRLGTRGYRAPEIVLKQPYGKKVDAFSCGVLLFTMLTKMMPMVDEADPKDKLYHYIARKRTDKFWRAIDSTVQLSNEVKNLLEGLLCYQPRNRMSICQHFSKSVEKPCVFNDPWFNGPVYSQEELIPIMRELVSKARRAEKELAEKKTSELSQKNKSN